MQGIAPTAHQGFVTRAQTIRVETLYRHACQRGQALVLCGEVNGGFFSCGRLSAMP